MNAGDYTLDEVSRLLNTVVAGIRTGDDSDDRVYSLEEVHERTGFPISRMEAEIRSGVLEHTRYGRTIGLTSRQIALLVTRCRTKGTANADPTEEDEFTQVRKSSLRAAGRRRSVKKAAA